MKVCWHVFCFECSQHVLNVSIIEKFSQVSMVSQSAPPNCPYSTSWDFQIRSSNRLNHHCCWSATFWQIICVIIWSRRSIWNTTLWLWIYGQDTTFYFLCHRCLLTIMISCFLVPDFTSAVFDLEIKPAGISTFIVQGCGLCLNWNWNSEFKTGIQTFL